MFLSSTDFTALAGSPAAPDPSKGKLSHTPAGYIMWL
jgi:hypothetical protein